MLFLPSSVLEERLELCFGQQDYEFAVLHAPERRADEFARPVSTSQGTVPDEGSRSVLVRGMLLDPHCKKC